MRMNLSEKVDIQDETVNPWLAAAILVALVGIFVLAGLLISSLYGDQPVRTAIERDIARYKENVRAHPGDVSARLNLADAYVASGDYRSAERELKEAISLNPTLGDAYRKLGDVYNRNGEVDRAISEYQIAISMSPNEPSAYNQMGQIFLAQKKYKQAVEVYEDLIRKNPMFADAHYYLGFAFEKLGNKAKARIHYLEALKYVPDYSEAKEGLNRVSR